MANDALMRSAGDLARTLAAIATSASTAAAEGWADPDAPGGTCDHCGEPRGVCYLPDPFLADVHNREELSWWCRPCHAAQCEEI